MKQIFTFKESEEDCAALLIKRMMQTPVIWKLPILRYT